MAAAERRCRRASPRATYACAARTAASSVVAERQPGGDGRGERAAGAMRVHAGHARADELDHAIAVDEHVDDVGAVEVPALDHHRARAQRPQRVGRAHRVVDACGWSGRSAPRPRARSASRRAPAAAAPSHRVDGARRPAGGRRSWRPSPDRRPGWAARAAPTAAATASTIAALASMPVFTASQPRSATTASICATTNSGRHHVHAR